MILASEAREKSDDSVTVQTITLLKKLEQHILSEAKRGEYCARFSKKGVSKHVLEFIEYKLLESGYSIKHENNIVCRISWKKEDF